MHPVMIMEKTYKYSVIINEAHIDKWIIKPSVAHGKIINSKQIIYIYLILPDFSF